MTRTDVPDLAVPGAVETVESFARLAVASGARRLVLLSGRGEPSGRPPGVPEEWIGLLGYLFGEVLDGRIAHLTDGVQRALGREPRDFRDYARAAATTGVWNVEHRAAA